MNKASSGSIQEENKKEEKKKSDKQDPSQKFVSKYGAISQNTAAKVLSLS